MSTHRLISITALLLFAGAQTVGAADPIAEAEMSAKAAAATPEGKKYEQDVATAFGRDHGKTIQACAKDVKRPDLSDFRVFVRVGAAGQVEETLVNPSTNLAACLQGKLVAWKLEAPPRADQWVSIEVKLTSR